MGFVGFAEVGHGPEKAMDRFASLPESDCIAILLAGLGHGHKRIVGYCTCELYTRLNAPEPLIGFKHL